MSNHIQEQIIKAVSSGKKLEAIKLLRTVENLSLSEAKERVEAIENKLSLGSNRSESKANLVHTHSPARYGVVNIESTLPTEAFLFLQKGAVKEALRVLKEEKGLGASAANRLAKSFYTQHPEYTSDEITRLMRSNVSQSQSSVISSKKNASGKSKKNKKLGVIELIIIAVILFNVLKAILE